MMAKSTDGELIGDAVARSFISPNVCDSNLEAANVVDVLNYIANGISRVASSITADAAPGRDEAGGNVGSLTEAIMGVTAGLCRVAESISELAGAVRGVKP